MNKSNIKLSVPNNTPKKKNGDSSIKYTDDQARSIDFIIDWLNSDDYEPATLSGFAGTGKTTILKTIARSVRGKVAVTAPTHKAVRIVSNAVRLQGITTQKLLGLRPNTKLETFDYNKPQFDTLANNHVAANKLVMVDECSMINKGLKQLIVEDALQYRTKILFVGDPLQLPPVNEQYSETFKSKYLTKLSQIVRQDSTNSLVELLAIARNDVLHRTDKLMNALHKSKNQDTFDENTGIGYVTHGRRSFSKVLDGYFLNDKLYSNIDFCKYAAFENSNVTNANKYIRDRILAEPLKERYSPIIKDDVLTSYSTILDEFNSPIIVNSEDYIIYSIMNYNNKYMIKGFLVKLKLINGGGITNDIFVVDHTIPGNIERYKQVLYTLLSKTKAKRASDRHKAWDNFYEFKSNNLLLVNLYKADNKLLMAKDLDYGFGLTVHKTQGSTFNNICINATNIIYRKGGIPRSDRDLRRRLLYVALSRASESAQILI